MQRYSLVFTFEYKNPKKSRDESYFCSEDESYKLNTIMPFFFKNNTEWLKESIRDKSAELLIMNYYITDKITQKTSDKNWARQYAFITVGFESKKNYKHLEEIDAGDAFDGQKLLYWNKSKIRLTSIFVIRVEEFENTPKSYGAAKKIVHFLKKFEKQ